MTADTERATGRKAARHTLASEPPDAMAPRRRAPVSVRELGTGFADTAPAAASSLVSQAVQALRAMVLRAPGSGSFLGSEKDLMAALGVSRPTFRQAAKLLMHENLLTIKRGVGGGFFAQAPSGEAVSRAAALYLNMRHTTLRQISDAVAPLHTEAARLLACHPDPEKRARLATFVDRFENEDVPQAERNPFRRMLAFEQLLGELAGNPAIWLVMKVMRDLVRNARHAHFKVTPERALAYEQFQRRLADAVREGDAEMAVLLSKRHTDAIARWLDEEVVQAAA